jgi:5'-deoxynucleotidase YfbR-like HD superfamily hydrolase
MATLLQNYDEIKAEYTEAFADSTVSFREVLKLVGEILDGAADAVKLVSDEAQLEQLVKECEELYSAVLDADKIDIPGVPESLEKFVITFGKGYIRVAIEKLAKLF